MIVVEQINTKCLGFSIATHENSLHVMFCRREKLRAMFFPGDAKRKSGQKNLLSWQTSFDEIKNDVCFTMKSFKDQMDNRRKRAGDKGTIKTEHSAE